MEYLVITRGVDEGLALLQRNISIGSQNILNIIESALSHLTSATARTHLRGVKHLLGFEANG